MPSAMLCAAVIVRLPLAPISRVWFAVVIEMAPAVAAPSIFKSEFATFAIASVRLVIVPVRSSVPPLAVSVPAVEDRDADGAEPVTFVPAAIVPVPLIAPPAMVMPAASVNCVVPAPSSFSVFAPSAVALVNVRLPAVLISRVPVLPDNVALVALLAASSSSSSVAPLPIVSASVPVRAGHLERAASGGHAARASNRCRDLLEAGHCRASADCHAGSIRERAASELNLPVGDAFSRIDREAAAAADQQRLVCIVDRNRGGSRGCVAELERRGCAAGDGEHRTAGDCP